MSMNTWPLRLSLGCGGLAGEGHLAWMTSNKSNITTAGHLLPSSPSHQAGAT